MDSIIIILGIILLILVGLNHVIIIRTNNKCSNTTYGCCPDGITSKMNFYGTNCYSPTPVPVPINVGGCAGTRYGCCPDGLRPKMNLQGSNCYRNKKIGGCAGTRYGCCLDGITPKFDLQGTNCH
jgi:hypothetical protein